MGKKKIHARMIVNVLEPIYAKIILVKKLIFLQINVLKKILIQLPINLIKENRILVIMITVIVKKIESVKIIDVNLLQLKMMNVLINRNYLIDTYQQMAKKIHV